jgi:hypothetical protein
VAGLRWRLKRLTFCLTSSASLKRQGKKKWAAEGESRERTDVRPDEPRASLCCLLLAGLGSSGVHHTSSLDSGTQLPVLIYGRFLMALRLLPEFGNTGSPATTV